MKRIAIIGNAGGGKSTLARKLSDMLDIPHFEIDKFQWKPDWTMYPADEFEAAHDDILTREVWILDGFASWQSIEKRLELADTAILIDLPLWMHFWLIAERQFNWYKGDMADKPGGHPSPPPTKKLFEVVWNIDRDFMPRLRAMVDDAEKRGCRIFRIHDLDELDSLASRIVP